LIDLTETLLKKKPYFTTGSLNSMGIMLNPAADPTGKWMDFIINKIIVKKIHKTYQDPRIIDPFAIGDVHLPYKLSRSENFFSKVQKYWDLLRSNGEDGIVRYNLIHPSRRN
jgi:hypothetical protein